jgi:hypothetical protein
MTWLLTTVLCVVLVEIFVRLPLIDVISRINVIGRKALRTLGAKSVSDHWKEKILLAYAVSLFVSTMKLAGYLAAIGAVAVVLIFIFDYLGAMVGEFITDWPGVLFSLVVATLYFIVRKFYV